MKKPPDPHTQRLLMEMGTRMHRTFPGLPFLIVVGLGPEQGTATMGNTNDADQLRMVRELVRSFESGAARITHEGPPPLCECSGYDFEPKSDVTCLSCGKIRRATP